MCTWSVHNYLGHDYLGHNYIGAWGAHVHVVSQSKLRVVVAISTALRHVVRWIVEQPQVGQGRFHCTVVVTNNSFVDRRSARSSCHNISAACH